VQLKFLLPILFLCAISLAACGSSGSGDEAQGADPTRTVSDSEPDPSLTRVEPAEKGKRPWEQPRSAPQPKKIIIKDIKVGKGPPAKVGDELWVHYGAFDYATGKTVETSWVLTYKFELGSEFANEGWEKGLVGMKAGGRRELTVPPKFAPATGAEVFVVDLVAVK
jgi:FKBP-type peptidyl-prolyl cis-trans isomerase